MPDHRSKPLRWLSPLMALLATGAWADKPVDYQRLGWESKDDILKLPADQRPRIAPTCSGAWVTPIPANARSGDPKSTPIKATAQDVHYEPSGASVLTGSVIFRQGNRQVEADNAEVYQEASQGTFSGNIKVAEPGVVMTGQKAFVDFGSQEARIERAEFVAAPINAHGRADQIVRDDDGVITIARGEYSTCEPQHRSWYFVARDINLDPNTGRGTVKHGTLYVDDFPLFYMPYFNFPIDDRRQSGILVPRFGNTNDGGFDFAVPIYLNLAPNYDATVTPRIMTQRGAMAEGEFRYLLPYGGTGTFQGAYLPSDRLFGDRDRKSLFWKHTGLLSDHLVLNTNVNYVSDNAYFTDLGTDLNMANTTVEERTGELIYRANYWTLLSRVQSFQTIDPTITDVNKPYARLPQLLLNVGKPTPEGWQPTLLGEATYFQRQINDASGPQVDGGRYRLEPGVQYLVNEPWGFVKPGAKVRYVSYDLTGSGVTGNAKPDITVPSVTMDTGLIFERDAGRFLQTLEPRAFYLYAPYKNQNTLPVFDTVTSTFNYSQLFRDSRFSGGDRLDDANQVSVGTTSRLIDPEDGSEQFRASLGEIFYFANRKVNLDGSPAATSAVSGFAGELAAQFSDGWGGNANALWAPNGDHINQFSIAATYLPTTHDSLLNLGFNFRREDETLSQQALRQTQISFVQPLGLRWKFLGLWQYDLIQKESQDLLAGVEYESCCYSVRFIHRQFLTDPTNLSGGAELHRTAFFLEFKLKGLAGLGSSIDSLLGKNVYGYTQLLQQEQQDQRGQFGQLGGTH